MDQLSDNLNQCGYIPFGYHTDFIDYLADHPDLFKVITYKDLKWQKDDSADSFYPAEKRAWDKAMQSGDLDDSKIYVLIQHDVDSQPQRTMNLVRHEAFKGIPSNVMVFNRRVDRRHFISTGEMNYTSYDLDFDLLKQVQQQGFVIGYHMNAYEQAKYDAVLACKVFLEDVEALSRYVNIEFFSAHGGSPGPEQINNRDLDVSKIDTNLIWVHNGKTPVFDLNYSDGGINSMKRDPAKRDLRDFVKLWRRGKRYRVLTHPQYYHDPAGRSPRLSGTPWYEEVLSLYAEGPRNVAWQNAQPQLPERIGNKSYLTRHIGNFIKRITGNL